MTTKHLQTDKFYQDHSTHLIERYETADMSVLHQLFLHYIPSQSSVLDIGFGSGRDLRFLHDHDYKVWGIDPTPEFVEHVQRRFSHLLDHFHCDRIPFQSRQELSTTTFDAVVAIAVWMHLKKKSYAQAVEDIVSVLASSSTVIISYSKGEREHDDERYFEEVDQTHLDLLFESKGFSMIDKI